MKELKQIIDPGNEKEIIQKIIDGDLACFEILIRRYNSILYRLARSHGFNHQDAEDLMQETHLAAYRNLGKFAFRASYKTWISRIMINNCFHKSNSEYKKHGFQKNELTEENEKLLSGSQATNNAEDMILKKEFANILENSLQKIPLSYRMVFMLREMEGFSVAETSELLNITTVNVKIRLNRAKAMLQKQLESFYDSSDLYNFNLIYCDRLVKKVFDQILSTNDSHQ